MIYVNCLSSLTHLIHTKVGRRKHSIIMYHVKAKFKEDAFVSIEKLVNILKKIIKGKKVQVYNSCLIILCEVKFYLAQILF